MAGRQTLPWARNPRDLADRHWFGFWSDSMEPAGRRASARDTRSRGERVLVAGSPDGNGQATSAGPIALENRADVAAGHRRAEMRSYRALDAGLLWEPGDSSIPRRVWPRGRPPGACPIWDLLRIRRYIAGIWRHSSVWMVPPVALCGWFSRTLPRASFDSASRIEYTRREILARIWDRDLSAGEIAAAFTLTVATISEHLAVLRRAGLVEMTKVGPPVDIGPSPPRWPACTARSRMRANGVRQMISPSSRSL